MLKLAVLASTRATDMQAIIDAINSKKLDAKISVLISNKKNSYAIERARKNKLPAVFIESSNKEREEFDKAVSNEIEKHKADLILLIGYMRYLSKWFVEKYKNKIINIHPSLLPAFAGGMDKDVHKEVIDYGCKVSGCTLHFVDEGADTGPIIMQKAVEIEENETPDSLKEKVQKAEQEIILKSLDLFIKNKIKIYRRKVKIAQL